MIPLRPLLLAATAFAATPAWAQQGQSGQADKPRVTVQPYVEINQILTADLENDDVVTFTTLSAGVDASIATRRAEGQISARYDHLLSWDDDIGDSDILSGLARGSFLVGQGLSIEGGALATRTRTDLPGASSQGLVADDLDQTSQIYALYAGPTLSRPIGAARLDAAYRFGYAKVESPDAIGFVPGTPRRDFFDDSTTHLATARLSVAPRVIAPVGFAVLGAYEREDQGQLDGYYEGFFGRAEVLAPISSTVALTAGVGYEEIETGGRDPLLTATGAPVIDEDGRFVADPGSPKRVDYRTDGVFYDAGVVWRPNRRTEVRGAVGERYGSFIGTGAITYQATDRMTLAVGVYDAVQTFGRQLRTGLSNLPTSFITARDQFTQQFNGCVFSSGGQSPGGCLNSAFQAISTSSFRVRGIDGVVSVTRGPTQFGFGAGYANRDFNARRVPGVTAFGLEDENAYVQGFVSHQLDGQSGVDAQAFLNYYNQIGFTDDELLSAGAVASYFRQFGRLSTRASLGLYSFRVGDFDDSLSLQALLGARYTFGGVR